MKCLSTQNKKQDSLPRCSKRRPKSRECQSIRGNFRDCALRLQQVFSSSVWILRPLICEAIEEQLQATSRELSSNFCEARESRMRGHSRACASILRKTRDLLFTTLCTIDIKFTKPYMYNFVTKIHFKFVSLQCKSSLNQNRRITQLSKKNILENVFWCSLKRTSLHVQLVSTREVISPKYVALKNISNLIGFSVVTMRSKIGIRIMRNLMGIATKLEFT